MNSSTATSQWHARAQPTQFKPYRAPLTLQRVNLTAKARHNHTSSRRSAVVCCCQHRFVLYTKPDCPLCDGLKVRHEGCHCQSNVQALGSAYRAVPASRRCSTHQQRCGTLINSHAACSHDTNTWLGICLCGSWNDALCLVLRCSAQDKLQALIDRAAFMPSFLTGASLEVGTARPWLPCTCQPFECGGWRVITASYS